MFESTGWMMEEPNSDSFKAKYDVEPLMIVRSPESVILSTTEEIAIIQQYQFSSTLQRMSVIIQVPNEYRFKSYTKGSPELILSLSKPETIPPGIILTLQKYTEQGYRVIAFGCSEIDSNPDEVIFYDNNKYITKKI